MAVSDEKAISERVTVRSGAALREAILFCVIVYTLTWAWWGLRFARLWQTGQSIDRAQIGPLDVQIGMFVPLLVALVMRMWVSKEGVRGSLGLKRSWRVYAEAYFLPLLLGTAAVTFNHAAGLARFDRSGDSTWKIAMTMLLVSLPAVITALGEEYGWRGYLLPRLLTVGDVKGSIAMGVIWGIWHLPLVVVGLTYPGQQTAMALLVFVSCTVMMSFFFTAFHHLSAGSVAVAAVIHGAVNILSELSSPRYVVEGSPFLTNPFGIPTALLLFTAGIVVLWLRRSWQR